MKLRSYSVRSGVLISGFKVPRPPIFTEIPGGMYTHVSTLNMKIHENSDFLPVFMVNGGQNWGLWKYVSSIWRLVPYTSEGKLWNCRPVFGVIVSLVKYFVLKITCGFRGNYS